VKSTYGFFTTAAPFFVGYDRGLELSKSRRLGGWNLHVSHHVLVFAILLRQKASTSYR
jgi:hypothetical protein